MKKIILVTIGDINGVGIEILIKIWKTKLNNRFILITNKKIFEKYLIKNKNFISINEINESIQNIPNIPNIQNLNYKDFINIYNIDSIKNDENSYKALIHSYELLKKYPFFSGVVNLPINKDKIIKNLNNKFIGQTEFYMKISKIKIANMIFIYKKLIFLTLTTHIPLNKINKNLSKKNYVYDKIISLSKTLKGDFNIKNPRLVISGINPHAGENNTIGDEESKYIKPAINRLKKKRIDIKGPYSGDGIINKRNFKKYNCFVFNYHDQALIPFKLLSENKGINFTSGLDIIRVSPDHGTGYDIVGKNIAKIDGIINCFKFVNLIDKNRN